jgi:hypothetical protein
VDVRRATNRLLEIDLRLRSRSGVARQRPPRFGTSPQLLCIVRFGKRNRPHQSPLRPRLRRRDFSKRHELRRDGICRCSLNRRKEMSRTLCRSARIDRQCDAARDSGHHGCGS